MEVLIFMLMILIVIAFALSTRYSDEDNIRAFLENKGWTVVSINRNMLAEAFTAGGARYYECTYRDQDQVLHTKQLAINFWKDVSFID